MNTPEKKEIVLPGITGPMPKHYSSADGKRGGVLPIATDAVGQHVTGAVGIAAPCLPARLLKIYWKGSCGHCGSETLIHTWTFFLN